VDQLRPALARELAEALEVGGTDDARVAHALFTAARRVLRPPGPNALPSICRRARAHPGSVSVEALARDAGVSVRTLERHFLTHVGLSPKRWLRILRFQRVVGEGDPGPDLLGRALRAGYYDQAHFLRDFREFAGTTPGRFFGTDGDRLARAFLEG
jgi:transcriptional regulator GlxA family with amidase domain